MPVNKVESNQLVLFHGTDNSMTDADYFRVDSKKTDDGQMKSMTLGVLPRKDLAKALGLSPKKDKEQLDEDTRELTDELKRKMGSEVAGIVQSDNWTGWRMKATKAKDGTVTKTLVFKSASRKQIVTMEKIAKAYGMSVDDVRAMIERQLAEIKAKEESTHDVTSTPGE